MLELFTVYYCMALKNFHEVPQMETAVIQLQSRVGGFKQPSFIHPLAAGLLELETRLSSIWGCQDTGLHLLLCHPLILPSNLLDNKVFHSFGILLSSQSRPISRFRFKGLVVPFVYKKSTLSAEQLLPPDRWRKEGLTTDQTHIHCHPKVPRLWEKNNQNGSYCRFSPLQMVWAKQHFLISHPIC